MDNITMKSLRNNLVAVMDQVCETGRPVVVTRNEGGHVVLIALDEFRAMEETVYLLGSRTNALRLLEGIAVLEGDR